MEEIRARVSYFHENRKAKVYQYQDELSEWLCEICDRPRKKNKADLPEAIARIEELLELAIAADDTSRAATSRDGSNRTSDRTSSKQQVKNCSNQSYSRDIKATLAASYTKRSIDLRQSGSNEIKRVLSVRLLKPIENNDDVESRITAIWIGIKGDRNSNSSQDYCNMPIYAQKYLCG